MSKFRVTVGRIRTETADFEIGSCLCSQAVASALEMAASDEGAKRFRENEEHGRFVLAISLRAGLEIGWDQADPMSKHTKISIRASGLEADPEAADRAASEADWPDAGNVSVAVERFVVERRAFEVEAESPEAAIARAPLNEGGDETGWELLSALRPYVLCAQPSEGIFCEADWNTVCSGKLQWMAEANGLEALPAGALNAMDESLIMEGFAAKGSPQEDDGHRQRII